VKKEKEISDKMEEQLFGKDEKKKMKGQADPKAITAKLLDASRIYDNKVSAPKGEIYVKPKKNGKKAR